MTSLATHSASTPPPVAIVAACTRIPAAREGCLSPRDFEVFVHDYTTRLLQVARRVLRSEDDAADAVQEALLAAFRSHTGFQGASTVYTWLHRIVVNVCLMKLRSRQRKRTVSLVDTALPHDEACCRRRLLSEKQQTADAALESSELRDLVRRYIDRLPEDYRTILLLRDIEQYNTNQTADVLNLTHAAVKTRLHRARQALKRLLEPMLTHEEPASPTR